MPCSREPQPPPPPTVTPIPTPTVVVIIRPTATPVPIASATPKVTATPLLIAANLATYPAASRLTPPAPHPANPDRPLFDFADSPGLNTFAIAIGLQVIVLIVVGAVVVARVRRRS